MPGDLARVKPAPPRPPSHWGGRTGRSPLLRPDLPEETSLPEANQPGKTNSADCREKNSMVLLESTDQSSTAWAQQSKPEKVTGERIHPFPDTTKIPVGLARPKTRLPQAGQQKTQPADTEQVREISSNKSRRNVLCNPFFGGCVL
jgi:hypothetical protein